MGQFFLTFEPVFLVMHFVFAIFLIGVILLQSGKGSDIGTAFGVGNSQALLGTTGAPTLLTKLTAVAAFMFLVTSLSLATASKYESGVGGGGSEITNELKAAEPKGTTNEAATPPSTEPVTPPTK